MRLEFAMIHLPLIRSGLFSEIGSVGDCDVLIRAKLEEIQAVLQRTSAGRVESFESGRGRRTADYRIVRINDRLTDY